MNVCGIGIVVTNTIGFMPINLQYIQLYQFYYDIIYSFDEVQFLIDADEKDYRVLYGLRISCHQIVI